MPFGIYESIQWVQKWRGTSGQKIPLKNPVAATRQRAANFPVSGKECGALPSRREGESHERTRQYLTRPLIVWSPSEKRPAPSKVEQETTEKTETEDRGLRRRLISGAAEEGIALEWEKRKPRAAFEKFGCPYPRERSGLADESVLKKGVVRRRDGSTKLCRRCDKVL